MTSNYWEGAVDDLAGDIERDGKLRSTLKRAGTLDDVIGLRAVDRFAARVAGGKEGKSRDWAEQSASRLAILLAHPMVERKQRGSERGRALAVRLGDKQGARPGLSELRFAQLIHANSEDERMRLLRRALGLLGSKISPRALASGWMDLQIPQGRRRFARDYFNAGEPASNELYSNATQNLTEDRP